MPSLTITTRRTRSGPRYVVRYRLGGRTYPVEHGGSFRTLREAKARRDLIGGEFCGHGPKQEETALTVVDASFPGVKSLGVTDSFRITDEWYAQKNLADDLHVILVQNTEGLTGPMYRRPNFPQTWARMHGQGRIFYTSMGHREDVWENPKYQGLLLGALAWATGKVDADVTQNVSRVTPGYREVASNR